MREKEEKKMKREILEKIKSRLYEIVEGIEASEPLNTPSLVKAFHSNYVGGILKSIKVIEEFEKGEY